MVSHACTNYQATLVFDALGLESMCPNMTRPDPKYLPRDFPPMASDEDVQRDLKAPSSNAIYVDGDKGSDSAAGTDTSADLYLNVNTEVASPPT